MGYKLMQTSRVSYNHNHNYKNKINFNGTYKVDLSAIKNMPFELYNYLRKGGEADSFIKSLDKSIKAVVTKEEDSIICSMSAGQDIESAVELDYADVEIAKEQLEATGQMINRLLKISKPVEEIDEQTKNAILRASRLN